MKKVHITQVQRYEIAAYLRAGFSQAEIARLLNKSRSVICREINRNKNSRGHYSGGDAEMFSRMRKEKKRSPRKLTRLMREEIVGMIRELHCSQECVCGYFRRLGKPCVSHEWIYNLIRRDKAGGGDLYRCLPHSLKHRRRPVNKPMPIADRVSIDERPAVVEDRCRFGDWEMDTIVGKAGKGVIVTLVERTSKKLLMARSPKGKDSKSVARLVVQLLMPFSKHVLSITTDNGSEFADHKYIAKKLHTSVYFAHPYSSWEKGLIENTNKLIRQFIPKDTDFSSLSDDYILHVQTLINRRPRKLLNFFSPKQIFLLSLHNSVAL
jgi:IS30 family transposase